MRSETSTLGVYTKIITIVFKKILIFISLLFALFASNYTFAGVIDIPAGDGVSKLQGVSMAASTSDNFTDNVNNIGKNILRTFKLIISALMVVYLVYVGAEMIMAMGKDDEALSKSKRQLRYALVAFLFINIPGTIYDSLHRQGAVNLDVTNRNGLSSWTDVNNSANVFINPFNFGYTIDDSILGFIKVTIFIIAVFMFVFEGVKIMTARGRDDKLKEAKSKLLYTILALVFVGVIDVWKQVAFSGSIADGKNLFDNIANLSLFFAGPVAIVFLILAGYYYVTSGGNEEKVKKAKSIVVNTVIATLILLASYTFLLDLATL
ncbi:MAG: hypothetical protein PHG82_00925 [Candidatus Gracilibacteria bacterium]|nr:hypothetical protein [Candidatus Gracilibacteria bacterium]